MGLSLTVRDAPSAPPPLAGCKQIFRIVKRCEPQSVAALSSYPTITASSRITTRRLLNMAVDATDPVERLRWVATWFTAGLQHVFQSWKKPFNPILGETWQV